ncbi:MAG: SpoIID/LytB domain-containing protein [Actinomycetota bacterium]
MASFVSPTPAEAQGSPVFVFHGAGWGHGVGMSQNGARNMADQGYDHVGILAHYYPNTVFLPTAAPLGDIRVHIGDASRVEFTSAGSLTFEKAGTVLNSVGSGTITVSAHDGGLQVGSVWTPVSTSDPVMLSFPQPVKISNNGHRYLWGKIQLTVKNGKVRVVEVLDLEQYVLGISEMPAAWPLQALMAQAIAARTYAHEVTLHRRASSEWAQEYDISGTTVDQNYIGWDAQDGPWDQKWTAAVKATAGVEIVDSAGPVRAYYSASNGGWTETAAYVFSNDVSHTVAAPDPFDAGGHNWSEWTRTYSQSAMSRWLNRYSDTSVGTLTQINVLGGAGASGRIDKSTVELVGTSGTKRVTGRRLMVVMNAGIFGEGLGLDDHLPGTYTTIGNGASAGFPQATGQQSAPTVTPDPVDADTEPAFTPPPGWTPEPGTGTPPVDAGTPPSTSSDDTESGDDGEGESGDDADANADETDTSDDDSDAGDSDAGDSDAGDSDAGDTTEDTTGDDTAGSSSGSAPTTGFTPPPGWTPEPGTGTPPLGSGSPPVTDGASDGTDDAGNAPAATAAPNFVPPPGWTPEPGTGTPPIGSAGGADTPPAGATGIPPAADSTGSGTSDGGFTPPEDWTPETGTGTPPLVLQNGSAGQAGDDAGPDIPPGGWIPPSTGGTGGGDASRYIPPADWSPEPGTGTPPINPARAGGLASSVLLVTRVPGNDDEPAQFRVITPGDSLADEAEARLSRLQTQAALALFADFDIDGYVEAVSPRPVHGVCTAVDEGIACVSLEALQATDS